MGRFVRARYRVSVTFVAARPDCVPRCAPPRGRAALAPRKYVFHTPAGTPLATRRARRRYSVAPLAQHRVKLGSPSGAMRVVPSRLAFGDQRGMRTSITSASSRRERRSDSAWGNGHATQWRGVLRALARRDHVFFEHDTPFYATHRDTPVGDGVAIVVYPSFWAVRERALLELEGADAAIVTSYQADARDVASLVVASRAVRAFYDLDTPMTIVARARDVLRARPRGHRCRVDRRRSSRAGGRSEGHRAPRPRARDRRAHGRSPRRRAAPRAPPPNPRSRALGRALS
jgi:hypothetical protein